MHEFFAHMPDVITMVLYACIGSNDSASSSKTLENRVIFFIKGRWRLVGCKLI